MTSPALTTACTRRAYCMSLPRRRDIGGFPDARSRPKAMFPTDERTTRWQVSWLADQRFLAAFPEISPVAYWPQAPSSQLRVQPRIHTEFPISRLAQAAPSARILATQSEARQGGGGSCRRCSREAGISNGLRRAQRLRPDQKSMPRTAFIPAWNGCLTARISLTKSAYSHNSGLASRPVRITLVRADRASRPSMTEASDRYP